jgi:hypothetical protein
MIGFFDLSAAGRRLYASVKSQQNLSPISYQSGLRLSLRSDQHVSISGMSRPPPHDHEQLADAYNATVVMRVVLNEDHQISHGELIDTVSARSRRFKNWPGLIQALSICLKSQRRQPRDSRSKSNRS